MTTPQPKRLSDADVGDKVLVEFMVKSKTIYGSAAVIQGEGEPDTRADYYLPGGLKISSIIKKPWEPEVGKKCKYRSQFSGIVCLSPSYTIEAIVRDELFVSVTIDGKPRYTNFPKDQAVCAD